MAVLSATRGLSHFLTASCEFIKQHTFARASQPLMPRYFAMSAVPDALALPVGGRGSDTVAAPPRQACRTIPFFPVPIRAQIPARPVADSDPIGEPHPLFTLLA